MDDFSCEHLDDALLGTFISIANNDHIAVSPKEILERFTIPSLNHARTEFLETKDKSYWWQMIQILPSSYNQTRNVMMNYEVLANIYKSRKNHKLDEWRELCKWIETLPYSDLICRNSECARKVDDINTNAIADKINLIGNPKIFSAEDIKAIADENPSGSPIYNNKDDIDEAIHGLDIFTKNWCINCKKSNEQNDLIFRCEECPFENNEKCLIKSFAYKHKGNLDLSDFGSMGEY